MKPHIDVLMAVYNGERFIRQQIESIINQTYAPIHLTIRDNCSEDNTVIIIREFIQKYPDRITLMTSAENVGVIGNFTLLAQQARAEYIMFSDADDVWLPEKIAKTYQKMSELERMHGKHNPVLVHTDLKVVNENLEIVHPSYWKYTFLNPKLAHLLPRQLIQNQITGCTVMVNRALLDLANPIPQDIVMHDWWLGLCAAAFGASDYLDESTMLYRQHGNNQVGAKMYSLLSLIQRGLNSNFRKKVFEHSYKIFRQAHTFTNRYRTQLNKDQLNTLEAFIQFQNASFLQRGCLMHKHGFYRIGWFRNLFLWIMPRK